MVHKHINIWGDHMNTTCMYISVFGKQSIYFFVNLRSKFKINSRDI